MRRVDRQANYRKGLWAEKLAAWWLRLKGYRILVHRFKTPVGEVDIIAVKRDVLIGVEVKAYRTFDRGWEAVDRRQRLRVLRALQIFMTKSSKWASANVRFDIILWQFPKIKHIQHAWSQDDI